MLAYTALNQSLASTLHNETSIVERVRVFACELIANKAESQTHKQNKSLCAFQKDRIRVSLCHYLMVGREGVLLEMNLF